MWWSPIVEERIRNAQDQGAFDDLPGHGKPLQLGDQDSQDKSDDWLGNQMLRRANLLPEWLQLRKDVHEGRPAVIQALQAYRDSWRAYRAGESIPATRLQELEDEYVRLAREINRLIDRHNLRCPSFRLELARFMEDAPERERRRSFAQ